MNVDKSSDKRTQEECYICGKLCEPSRIKSHIRSHTNFMVYECEDCGNRFASKKSLRQHSLTHRTHYICEVCNKKFGDPSRLVAHRCTDEKEKKYFCETCGKGFLLKSWLTKHISVCHGDKGPTSDVGSNNLIEQQKEENSVDSPKNPDDIVYSCDLCPKILSSKRNLRRHRHLHTKEWPFSCKYCHKKFKQEDQLSAHIGTHTNKLHKCELCGRTFNRKSSLYKHILLHKRKENEIPVPKVKKEKFFVCDLCFKNFSSKQNLQRHQVLHTNKTPYTCEVCNKSFASVSYLKDHSFYHTNKKLFKCKECGKSYFNSRLLGQHVRRHKDPGFVCSVCGKGFYEIAIYNRHIAVHEKIKPYICDICHKGFSRLLTLQQHYIRHTKKNNINRDELVVSEENKDEKITKNFSFQSQDLDEKEESRDIDFNLDSASESSNQELTENFLVENSIKIEDKETYIDSNCGDVASDSFNQ